MKQQKYIIGIDDAGRGPVIGPMVLSGIVIKDNKTEDKKLKKLDVKDSKLLQKNKREQIAEHLVKNYNYEINLVSPDEIDSRTFAGTNLNKIEAVKSAQIINNLIKKTLKDLKQDNNVNNIKFKAIIDCPSPNITAWANYLKTYIEKPGLVKLQCEHKADMNHKIVSAASIIAKQTREIEIEKIKKEFNIDFGSGYCHDPLTSDFLKGDIKHLQEKGIIRKSWYTYTRVIAEKEQKKLEF